MSTANYINIRDKSYPFLLKEIHDPPQRLFYRGNLEILQKTCLSIVGTRKNSDYGAEMVKKIVSELAILDIAIVSGLAKGIDAVAHLAALENELPTIAVLGSGIDYIYPPENFKLAEEILKTGLIISEYPGTNSPTRLTFPQRNRIISGLSIGTIVIEAPPKSGALITANFALEQGREVFAIPGDVDRQNNLGILKLLQKGAAYPVSCGTEITEILKEQPHLFKKMSALREKHSTKLQKNLSKTQNYQQQFLTKFFQKNNQIFSNPTSLNYSLTALQQQIFSLIPRHRSLTLDKIIQNLKTAQNPITDIQEILSALSVMEIYGLIKMEGNSIYLLQSR